MINKTSRATFFSRGLLISSIAHGLIFLASALLLSSVNVHPGFQQGKLVINRMDRIANPIKKKKKASKVPKTSKKVNRPKPVTPGVQSFEKSVLNPNIRPEYPAIAIKRGWEGFVKLKFMIDPKGNVRVEVLEEQAHPMLKDSALKAAKSWKFKPSMTGAPYSVEKRVVFQIN